MKTILFFIGFLPALFNAQTFVNRTYSNLYDVQARATTRMGNGNFLVTGTQAFANGFLAVHDSTGVCLSSSYLSPGALSSYSSFDHITRINDTLAIIGGRISLAIGPTENWQGITIAVNASGMPLWSAIHPTNSPEDGIIRDIEKISDSTFLSLSTSLSGINNTLSMMHASGSVYWTKALYANADAFTLKDICLVGSTIYACGTRYQNGDHSGILLTLDSAGNYVTGMLYDHPIQPDFIQVIVQDNALIIANRGYSNNVHMLLKTDLNGTTLEQKTMNSWMAMPEEEAWKPLHSEDSSTFWFWNGGSFGSNAYRVSSLDLMPLSSFMHLGNIQTLYCGDSSIYMLSSGPMYGIKSNVIMQKHYSLTEADSVELWYQYCTYPNNEMPLNETAPTTSICIPTATPGNPPNPFYYPLLGNEPWINETNCVEMLGNLAENTLRFGPNPCDLTVRFEGYENQPYTLYNALGQRISSGIIDAQGYLSTVELASGNYIVRLSENTVPIHVIHGP